MDFTHLRHIVAVHRNRSFSRAAEEEGITQPALSRSIAAFEQRHDVILFDRGRGGVQATAAGLDVIDRAQKLLAMAADLERDMKRHRSGSAGRIAIGLGPLVAGLFLPRLTSLLLAAMPGLQIVTLTRPPDQLITDLLNDRIEMIVGNNWNFGRMPGIELERLGRLGIAAVVRADHPLAGKEGLRLVDLETYPVASPVDMPNGMAGSAGALVCDNFHILRETVLRTDCTWMSSPAFLADDLQEGRIVQLNLSDLQAESEILLVFKRSRTRSPAVSALVEEMRVMIRAMEGE